MIERSLVVTTPMGLHARPAALFVRTAHKFQSSLKVIKDDVEVDGKSIMGLLTLAAEGGATMRLVADGPDEAELMEAMSELFQRKFDED